MEIPFSKGLVGHSDGDCLIHAIIDALLGASGEGDIGQLFPDTDQKYNNIRSTVLLKEVMARIKKNEFGLVNLDTVIIADAPKMVPYILKMKEIICPILNIGKNELGIKAKTNEGMGLIGKGDAIACWVIALVGKNE